MQNLTAISQNGNAVSIGVVGGKTTFEQDGTMVFGDGATTWNDINMSVQSLSLGANAPGDWTIPTTGLIVKAFTGTGATTQSAHGSMEILHDYKEGTDIIPHLHWCPTTTGAGDVKWQLEYIWIDSAGTLSGSQTISVTVAASGTAGKCERTNIGVLSGTGLKIGSRLLFRLFRNPADAADTYAADAACFDIGVHYERDTLGSRSVTTK